MDPHGDRSWASSPHSPAPLALHDFMSQNALSSSTHEDSASRLGTVAAEAEGRSSIQAVGVVTNKSTPLAQEVAIDPYDEPSPEQETPPGGPDQEQSEEQDEPGDSVLDWKAIRVQVPLGKKAGKKTEWIRGWSQEIVAQGDTAYCACSGLSAEATPSTASTTSAATGTSRGKGRSDVEPPRPDEAGLGHRCQHCSRPVSPASSLPMGEEDLYGGRTRGLRKKMSGLVMRVMKGRKLTSPSPLGLGADGVLREEGPTVAPPPNKANNDEVLVDPDDLSSSGDEGQPRGSAGLKERQERLARAQELLNKQRQ